MASNNYVDDLGREWDGPFGFNQSEISGNVPTVPGVYQFLYQGADGLCVVYIGIATKKNNLRKRLLEHVRNSSNWALARIGDPTQYQVVVYPCDDETAHQIECYTVTNCKPPYNVRPEFAQLIPSIAVH